MLLDPIVDLNVKYSRYGAERADHRQRGGTPRRRNRAERRSEAVEIRPLKKFQIRLRCMIGISLQQLHQVSSLCIELLTNIDLLRGPERPPFLSLSTPTSRHSPLRTAERARIPETALLSVFFFKIRVFIIEKLFCGKWKFLLPPSVKLLFWECHILPGHRLLSLLAERSSFPLISYFPFFWCE